MNDWSFTVLLNSPNIFLNLPYKKLDTVTNIQAVNRTIPKIEMKISMQTSTCPEIYHSVRNIHTYEYYYYVVIPGTFPPYMVISIKRPSWKFDTLSCKGSSKNVLRKYPPLPPLPHSALLQALLVSVCPCIFSSVKCQRVFNGQS